MSEETRRVLFVVLDGEGYPASAQELVDGNWVEADPDDYFSVSDDLYFGENEEDGYVWSDENGFTASSMSAPGQPPSALEAELVGNAYLEHLRTEDSEVVNLDGVVFVYDAEVNTD